MQSPLDVYCAAAMAKKRISRVDLSWIIPEQLPEIGRPHGRAWLAVFPDEKDGWRVIVAAVIRQLPMSSDLPNFNLGCAHGISFGSKPHRWAGLRSANAPGELG